MVAVARQHLPVEAFRFGKPAGLVMLYGKSERRSTADGSGAPAALARRAPILAIYRPAAPLLRSCRS